MKEGCALIQVYVCEHLVSFSYRTAYGYLRNLVGMKYLIMLMIFFYVSRSFMAGAASQAGDANSSRAPGLTSGLQGSVNVHRGAYCWFHSDSTSVLLYSTFRPDPTRGGSGAG